MQIVALEQQKAAVLRAEQETEKALELLNEASKELRTIEKHRENWRQIKRLELIRKEQKNNDEIGAILHEHGKVE
jgi:flagellar export protein FliJ